MENGDLAFRKVANVADSSSFVLSRFDRERAVSGLKESYLLESTLKYGAGDVVFHIGDAATNAHGERTSR